jgi:hypothetical protein
MAVFSSAYLQAMAAAAGVGIAAMTPDINGVDAHLETKDNGSHPGFALNIQLKSSATRIERTQTGGVRYPLESKEHHRLCQRVVVPRILVILDLSTYSGDWVEVHDSGLLLRAPAWWASFRGQQPTTNATSVSITILSGARFTIDVLLGNMRSMESR